MKILLFFIYILVAVFVLFFSFRRDKAKLSELNCENGDLTKKIICNYITPIFVFLVSLIAYSTIGLWDRVMDDVIGEYEFFVFMFSNIVGIICFAIGYRGNDSYLNSKKLNFNAFLPKLKFRRHIPTGELVIVVSFVIIVIINWELVRDMVTKFGSGESYLDYSIRGERTAFSGLIQAFTSYFQVFFLLLPFYRCYSRKRIGAIDVAIVLLYFAWAFFSGDRTTLILIVLMFAVLINERFKNFSLKFLIVVSVIGVLALVMLGHLRAYNSIDEMINMIQKYGIKALVNVSSSGEFRYTTGTLFNYVLSNDSISDYRFLSVYFTEILMWIPNFLFPERPLPLAEQYMLDFYPSAPKGTGHGWFILTDGYMAFGVIGIAVEMLLYGMFVKFIYKRYFENRQEAIHAFLYSYFLLYLFYSVRSSVMLSIKNYLINVFPVIIIYYIFRKSFKCEKGVSNEK